MRRPKRVRPFAQRVIEALAEIQRAGPAGIKRSALQRRLGIGDRSMAAVMEELTGEPRRIHIAAWPRSGTKRYPAYAAGDLQDAPAPAYRNDALPVLKTRPVDAVQAAALEAQRVHEAWSSTWRPHCDSAAQWFHCNAA